MRVLVQIVNVLLAFLTWVQPLAAAPTGAPAENKPDLEPPAAKFVSYHWGSMYLTYRQLLDLTEVIGNKELQEKISHSPALQLLASFLLDHKVEHMYRGVAFLQLDYINGRAGYKMFPDYDGNIHPLSWQPNNIKEIVDFVDVYLTRVRSAADLLRVIQEGKIGLPEAYKKVREVSSDPYVPSTDRQQVSASFNSLIANLELYDPDIFARFAAEYPDAVAASSHRGVTGYYAYPGGYWGYGLGPTIMGSPAMGGYPGMVGSGAMGGSTMSGSGEGAMPYGGASGYGAGGPGGYGGYPGYGAGWR